MRDNSCDVMREDSLDPRHTAPCDQPLVKYDSQATDHGQDTLRIIRYVQQVEPDLSVVTEVVMSHHLGW